MAPNRPCEEQGLLNVVRLSQTQAFESVRGVDQSGLQLPSTSRQVAMSTTTRDSGTIVGGTCRQTQSAAELDIQHLVAGPQNAIDIWLKLESSLNTLADCLHVEQPLVGIPDSTLPRYTLLGKMIKYADMKMDTEHGITYLSLVVKEFTDNCRDKADDVIGQDNNTADCLKGQILSFCRYVRRTFEKYNWLDHIRELNDVMAIYVTCELSYIQSDDEARTAAFQIINNLKDILQQPNGHQTSTLDNIMHVFVAVPKYYSHEQLVTTVLKHFLNDCVTAGKCEEITDDHKYIQYIVVFSAWKSLCDQANEKYKLIIDLGNLLIKPSATLKYNPIYAALLPAFLPGENATKQILQGLWHFKDLRHISIYENSFLKKVSHQLDPVANQKFNEMFYNGQKTPWTTVLSSIDIDRNNVDSIRESMPLSSARLDSGPKREENVVVSTVDLTLENDDDVDDDAIVRVDDEPDDDSWLLHYRRYALRYLIVNRGPLQANGTESTTSSPAARLAALESAQVSELVSLISDEEDDDMVASSIDLFSDNDFGLTSVDRQNQVVPMLECSEGELDLPNFDSNINLRTYSVHGAAHSYAAVTGQLGAAAKTESTQRKNHEPISTITTWATTTSTTTTSTTTTTANLTASHPSSSSTQHTHSAVIAKEDSSRIRIVDSCSLGLPAGRILKKTQQQTPKRIEDEFINGRLLSSQKLTSLQTNLRHTSHTNASQSQETLSSMFTQKKKQVRFSNIPLGPTKPTNDLLSRKIKPIIKSKTDNATTPTIPSLKTSHISDMKALFCNYGLLGEGNGPTTPKSNNLIVETTTYPSPPPTQSPRPPTPPLHSRLPTKLPLPDSVPRLFGPGVVTSIASEQIRSYQNELRKRTQLNEKLPSLTPAPSLLQSPSPLLPRAENTTLKPSTPLPQSGLTTKSALLASVNQLFGPGVVTSIASEQIRSYQNELRNRIQQNEKMPTLTPAPSLLQSPPPLLRKTENTNHKLSKPRPQSKLSTKLPLPASVSQLFGSIATSISCDHLRAKQKKKRKRTQQNGQMSLLSPAPSPASSLQQSPPPLLRRAENTTQPSTPLSQSRLPTKMALPASVARPVAQLVGTSFASRQSCSFQDVFRTHMQQNASLSNLPPTRSTQPKKVVLSSQTPIRSVSVPTTANPVDTAPPKKPKTCIKTSMEKRVLLRNSKAKVQTEATPDNAQRQRQQFDDPYSQLAPKQQRKPVSKSDQHLEQERSDQITSKKVGAAVQTQADEKAKERELLKKFGITSVRVMCKRIEPPNYRTQQQEQTRQESQTDDGPTSISIPNGKKQVVEKMPSINHLMEIAGIGMDSCDSFSSGNEQPTPKIVVQAEINNVQLHQATDDDDVGVQLNAEPMNENPTNVERENAAKAPIASGGVQVAQQQQLGIEDAQPVGAVENVNEQKREPCAHRSLHSVGKIMMTPKTKYKLHQQKSSLKKTKKQFLKVRSPGELFPLDMTMPRRSSAPTTMTNTSPSPSSTTTSQPQRVYQYASSASGMSTMPLLSVAGTPSIGSTSDSGDGKPSYNVIQPSLIKTKNHSDSSNNNNVELFTTMKQIPKGGKQQRRYHPTHHTGSQRNDQHAQIAGLTMLANTAATTQPIEPMITGRGYPAITPSNLYNYGLSLTAGTPTMATKTKNTHTTTTTTTPINSEEEGDDNAHFKAIVGNMAPSTSPPPLTPITTPCSTPTPPSTLKELTRELQIPLPAPSTQTIATPNATSSLSNWMNVFFLEATPTVPAYLFNGESRDIPTPPSLTSHHSADEGLTGIGVDSAVNIDAGVPTPQTMNEILPVRSGANTGGEMKNHMKSKDKTENKRLR